MGEGKISLLHKSEREKQNISITSSKIQDRKNMAIQEEVINVNICEGEKAKSIVKETKGEERLEKENKHMSKLYPDRISSDKDDLKFEQTGGSKSTIKNPFGKESINPFDEWATATPRNRMRTPTNATRDLLGGGKANVTVKNVEEAVTGEPGNEIDTNAEPENLEVLIQTPKRKEKIVTKTAVIDSHIYEEIGPLKETVKCKDTINDSSNQKKEHIYDELIKPKEEKKNEKEQPGIFRRIKNFVFRAYSSVTPWWLARKFYWKKERPGEETFYATIRRNSKSKNGMNSKIQLDEPSPKKDSRERNPEEDQVLQKDHLNHHGTRNMED